MTGGGGSADVADRAVVEAPPCPVGCGGLALGHGLAPCGECLPVELDVMPLAGREIDELAGWLLAAIADEAAAVLVDEPRPGVMHARLGSGGCRACMPGAVAAERLELHHTAVLRWITTRARLAHWVAKGNGVERGRELAAPVVMTLCALALGPYRDRGGCPVDLQRPDLHKQDLQGSDLQK